MTNEQAIKDFEGTNENYRDQLSKYGYVMDKAEKDVVNQIIERNELAISALSEELSEDGTLTVHVKDGSKVKRVFVMGDNIFGGLYYSDSAEEDNTTHWIDGDAICPKCGKDKFEGLDADIWADWKPMYCPNCGRKAVQK